MTQVVDAGHRVVGRGWVVEGGGDFFVAALGDLLSEGGVNLLGFGDEALGGGCQGFDPAGRGCVVLWMADDQWGFVEGWVVGGDGGGQVGFAESEAGAAHGGVGAGFEDVEGFHGYALQGRWCAQFGVTTEAGLLIAFRGLPLVPVLADAMIER